VHAIGTRAQLTPIERQAALLAAGGRSSKQIAQELYLATRTVENHLQHVYEKLGISGRKELGDALASVGVDLTEKEAALTADARGAYLPPPRR
jgi:DNA-binding CsgD family transcriptional regulator